CVRSVAYWPMFPIRRLWDLYLSNDEPNHHAYSLCWPVPRRCSDRVLSDFAELLTVLSPLSWSGRALVCQNISMMPRQCFQYCRHMAPGLDMLLKFRPWNRTNLYK